MGTAYNGIVDPATITGPSGWYNLLIGGERVHTYVNQEYDEGGWVCVLANRGSTGGMNNLTYSNAVNTCNYRTGGSDKGSNTVVPPAKGFGALSNYNIWIGLKYWSALAGRVTADKITVVQFVHTTNGRGLHETHTKRYRWRFNSFTGTYAHSGATGIADETGTGSPGYLNYHAANGFSLTTYDNDQDSNGGNCSTYYGNNPFWYGSCWSGNYFAGGGYADRPYWNSSGEDNHQYGAVYIK